MKHFLIYSVCLLLFSSCQEKKRVDWTVSLKAGDKKPYGSYLAFESLKYYFPSATIHSLSKGFRYNRIVEKTGKGESGNALMILLGLDFYLSDEEMNALLDFVGEGNEIMLFCTRLDNKLETKLGCYKEVVGNEEAKPSVYYTGKNNINALSLYKDTRRYGYEGRTIEGYFQVKDLSIDSLLDAPAMRGERQLISGPDTIGTVHGKPDIVRYSIGRGHITLHAAPLVASNYFLLQQDNHKYLEGIWETFPAGIRNVYWSEYFKHNAERSDLSILWRYPPTRWALIIAIATLLLYVLFEGKRRQRVIPILEKPENTSVSFAETVGRLYYNKGDHTNLASKMIQHFLEWIRLHYYLNTNELNEDFIKNLAHKSGQPEPSARRIVELIHDIRTRTVYVDETVLFELHSEIQKFYNR